VNDALATTVDTVSHAPSLPPPPCQHYWHYSHSVHKCGLLSTPKTRHTPLVPSLNV